MGAWGRGTRDETRGRTPAASLPAVGRAHQARGGPALSTALRGPRPAEPGLLRSRQSRGRRGRRLSWKGRPRVQACGGSSRPETGTWKRTARRASVGPAPPRRGPPSTAHPGREPAEGGAGPPRLRAGTFRDARCGSQRAATAEISCIPAGPHPERARQGEPLPGVQGLLSSQNPHKNQEGLCALSPWAKRSPTHPQLPILSGTAPSPLGPWPCTHCPGTETAVGCGQLELEQEVRGPREQPLLSVHGPEGLLPQATAIAALGSLSA